MGFKRFTFIISIFMLFSNLYGQTGLFNGAIKLGLIENNEIIEASGIAASHKNENVLWTHNDSGDTSRIFAFDTRGKHLGTFYLKNIRARDWEDIAVGPGPIKGQPYIYVGDIGDNHARYELKYIHRFPEPIINSKETPIKKVIHEAETITFRYPDAPRDAETLLVDPVTSDVFIVSKRERQVRVYRAPYPQSTTEVITLDSVATINMTRVVAGDISPTGSEILLKTYKNIFYWEHNFTHPLWRTFESLPDTIPYIPDPLGEAICWAADESGFFTISEESVDRPAYLYFYPRQDSVSSK